MLRGAKGFEEPGGKNGATSLRKAIKAPAGLGPDSLHRGRASSPRCRRLWPFGRLSGARAAQGFACLASNTEVGITEMSRGSRRSASSFTKKANSAPPLSSDAGRDCLQPSARRSFSTAGLADSADEGDFLLVWRSCRAAIRSLAFPSEAFGLLVAFGRRLLHTRVLPRAIDDASRA